MLGLIEPLVRSSIFLYKVPVHFYSVQKNMLIYTYLGTLYEYNMIMPSYLLTLTLHSRSRAMVLIHVYPWQGFLVL